MNSICIFGVFVADLCFFAEKIPVKGETVLGNNHIIGPGGKGSNQAIAAARLGGNVNFITKIGKELSIITPTDPNTSSGNDSLNILWLSPDEWLIYSNNKISYEQQNLLEDNLFNNISNINQGSVTNVTDHWIMINLKGSKIYDLLSKSSPYDFTKVELIIFTVKKHSYVRNI